MTDSTTDASKMQFYRDRLNAERALIANSTNPVAIAVHRELADKYRAILQMAQTAAFVDEAESSNQTPAYETGRRPLETGPLMHPSKHPIPGKGGSGSTSR